MPIVTVRMFTGRSRMMKEFIARGITDLIAEYGGSSREGVHVIFEETEKEDWAVGPRLAASRPPRPRHYDGPAYMTIGRIGMLPGKESDYLAWRRDRVYELMAGSEGFLSSTVIRSPSDAEGLILINKWANREAKQTYSATPTEAELKKEVTEYAQGVTKPMVDGDVVDVFFDRTEPG